MDPFLKTYDANNAFEQAFLKLGDTEQLKYKVAFGSWDAYQRFDAHLKFRELQQLKVDDDCLLSAVLDDVNEGGSGASTLAFLGNVRGSIQAIVDNEVYTVHEEDEAAIAKFNELLSAEEKKRVVGNIAYEVMQSICSCIEDEEDHSPFRWSLVMIDKQGQCGPPIARELHAYLEDEWILPKVDS